MFSKILIANRGEIACRVIKTAKKMGIRTVAVYSDADRDALHVEMADEAVHIGPPPAAESYLVAEKILQAVEQTGADAVHPGYGFLSENVKFAEALQAANVAFIGPNTRAIGAMGDKIESKKLAAAAGVSTVPGYLGVIGDADEAVKIAGEIGYPVMIKASAGGGGKGMRVAYDEAETREGFESARNEARSSFADDRVFIEKFIEEPRHIEIQVLGDKHGKVIHLGERECSIQRRHQKVIEEAPSPFVDADLRAEMGAQAIALAQVVAYDSAGTVEMIVDAKGGFYFLEMNTRLQVEHPVTELVTGIDLVEQMIRSAAGEPLNIEQSDVRLDGWAVESRVYAEDPLRNFLPSIGRIVRYHPPEEIDGVRIDTGVSEGSEISMYYDPMVAKLCTHGLTRDDAIAKMRLALDEYSIRGVRHNIEFLSAVMAHSRFQAGRLSTNFIPEEYPDGFQGGALSEAARDALIGVALLVRRREQAREVQISGQLPGWRHVENSDWVVAIDGENHDARIVPSTRGYDVFLEGRFLNLQSDWQPASAQFKGLINGLPFGARVEKLADGYRISHDGASVTVFARTRRLSEFSALMPEKVQPDTSNLLLCPMPGLVVSIGVAEGDEVQEGQALAVVEAMKMENVLRAERHVTIKKIHVAAGDSLAVDQVIMEFE